VKTAVDNMQDLERGKGYKNRFYFYSPGWANRHCAQSPGACAFRWWAHSSERGSNTWGAGRIYCWLASSRLGSQGGI